MQFLQPILPTLQPLIHHTMKHLLYLADDYPYSSVHHNLVQHIADKEEWKVTVFCTLREPMPDHFAEERYGDLNYRVIAVPIGLSPIRYRISFGRKTVQRQKLLEEHIDLGNIDHILCSTTFSDGAVAYALLQQRSITYSTIVRSTDTDFYLRLMPHLWRLGSRIVNHASHIVAITPSIKSALLNSPIGNSIEANRIHIIPNGIHPYWHEHQLAKESHPHNIGQFEMLFVGDFSRNKNGLGVIKAFLHLQHKNPNIRITLVGGAPGDRFRDHSHRILHLIKGNPAINFVGQIRGPEKIAEIFHRADLFVMVSHNETFGLVYIEALSQGLPIVYSRGHGIDGFFDQIPVGEKADSHNPQSIVNAMDSIIKNYDQYTGIGKNLQQFNWKNIAEEYQSLFLTK